MRFTKRPNPSKLIRLRKLRSLMAVIGGVMLAGFLRVMRGVVEVAFRYLGMMAGFSCCQLASTTVSPSFARTSLRAY